jgi:hypothetical protein
MRLGFNVVACIKIGGSIYKPRNIVKYEFRQLSSKIVLKRFMR